MFIPKHIFHFVSFFLLPVLILAPVSPASAAGILYAAPSAVGSGNCSSWDNACTLQTALSQAVSGDEIWVIAGVHYPGAAGDRTATFTLQNGVAVYGGFVGTPGTEGNFVRDWQLNKTILSGDIDGDDVTDPHGVVTDTTNIQGENAYHVVTGDGVDNTAVLDGFIITAGQANGDYPSDSGGGMYNNNSSPTLTNVAFSGNYADQGSGMYNYNSNPTLTNVTFNNNSSNNYGGGMYNEEGSGPMLTKVNFSNNSAQYGGGMYNYNSSPTLTNVIFSSNIAYDGGGVYNSTSNPMLTTLTFIGNSANHFGGGIYNFSSSPTLTNVTFSGNSAEVSGGGMYNENSSNPMLINVILWGNSALHMAEIYNETSTPTVSYSDIRDCDGSSSWNSYCGKDGGGNIDADPLFINSAVGNLRLGFGSPVIDAGNNISVTVTTDLDDLPRFADGNGDGDPVVDIGAYEAGQMICGVAANTAYTFDKNSNVVITTTTTMNNLSCLYVDEMELNHPNATAGIQTGRYWLIRGLKSDNVTNATGFSVTLTLPTTFTPDDSDKLCRYPGNLGGAGWDCAADSHTDNSITRNGVTAFSDWAVGNNVGPTAVRLTSFQASSAPSPLVWLFPTALAIAVFFTKKRPAKT